MAALTNIKAILCVLQSIEQDDVLGGAIESFSRTWKRYETNEHLDMSVEERDVYERRFLMKLLMHFGHKSVVQQLLFDQLDKAQYLDCSESIRRAVIVHLLERKGDIQNWIAGRQEKECIMEQMDYRDWIIYFKHKNRPAK